MSTAQPAGRQDLERELDRRLATIAGDDYDDPARVALPARDFVGLAAFVVVICVLTYVVLY